METQDSWIKNRELHLFLKDPEIKWELKKRALESRMSLSRYLVLTSTFFEKFKNDKRLKREN